MGVIRDPAKNTVIDLHVEYAKGMLSDGIASRLLRTHVGYYRYVTELIDILDRAAVVARAEPALTTTH
jgi:hypothetical protein